MLGWLWRAAECCVAVAEWRHPVVSSLYLLLVNALFWYFAFYGDERAQSVALLAVVVVVGSVETAAKATTARSFLAAEFQPFVRRCKEFREKSSLQRLCHVVVSLATLQPLRMVLRPFFYTAHDWLVNKKFQLAVVILAGKSYHCVSVGQKEPACWYAYTTVLAALIGPAWTANCVDAQIWAAVLHALTQFYANILLPMWQCCRRLWLVFRYYAFLEWLPPLVRRLSSSVRSAMQTVNERLVKPTQRRLAAFVSTLRYYVCGYWVRPLGRRLRHCANSLLLAVRHYLVNPPVDLARKFCAVAAYILLGRWIPRMMSWLNETLVCPLWAAGERVEQLVLYVALGGAFVDGAAFVGRQMRRATAQTLARARDASVAARLALAASIHVSRQRLQRAARRCRLRMNELLVECAEVLRTQAKAVQQKLVSPVAAATLGLVRTACSLLFVNTVQPAALYVQVWLRRYKHHAWVHWIEPFLFWARAQLPEKSPFVDDSDTELRDFLPARAIRQQSWNGSEADNSDSNTGWTPRHRTQANSRQLSRKPSDAAADDDDDERSASARSLGCIADVLGEEAAFVAGLAFPPVDASDSSDDEFSLRRRPAAAKKTRRRRHASGPSVAAATTAHATVDNDDDFEILDSLPTDLR